MWTASIRRQGMWLETISSALLGMLYCQLFIQDSLHITVWRPPATTGGEVMHPLLYSLIDEAVTMSNSETAEVQGEATARREQCGYIVHNLQHLGSN